VRFTAPPTLGEGSAKIRAVTLSREGVASAFEASLLGNAESNLELPNFPATVIF
jgi:hypothetical protein